MKSVVGHYAYGEATAGENAPEQGREEKRPLAARQLSKMIWTAVCTSIMAKAQATEERHSMMVPYVRNIWPLFEFPAQHRRRSRRWMKLSMA